MEEFLIGTGIALLLALIGWSEQIKTLRNDTMEVEKEFSKDRNIKWSQIRPLIRSKSSPEEKLEALNKIIHEDSIRENRDVDIISELSTLDGKRGQLEKLYNIKYKLILILTSLFFISGMINYFIEESCLTKILWFRIPKEFIPVCICILFSIGILFFNTHLNNVEGKYRDKLIQLKDQL